MIIDITVVLEDATAQAEAVNDIAVTVTLDNEIVNPEETFCERVDECLDIPTEDGQYVLNIASGIISWEEFSASGLVDGNGTTVNGNKVDLGGDVIQDTILFFDPTDLYFILGDIANGKAFGFGDTQNDGSIHLAAIGVNTSYFQTSDFNIDASNGVQVLVNNSSGVDGEFQVQPYGDIPAAGISLSDTNNSFSVGYYALMDGTHNYSNIYYGVLDEFGEITDTSRFEANENEVHGRKYTTVGGNYNGIHCNTNYSQLEYNKESEDGQDTGTCFTLNEDGLNHFQGGAILNQFDNYGFIYIGSESVDGSWRFATDSGSLVIQKRVSGSWVTKQTLV